MIYSYQCPDCGHRFDVKQRMLEERKATCPECGAQAEFRPCWDGGILFDFPTLDATEIMNREGKWNY